MATAVVKHVNAPYKWDSDRSLHWRGWWLVTSPNGKVRICSSFRAP